MVEAVPGGKDTRQTLVQGSAHGLQTTHKDTCDDADDASRRHGDDPAPDDLLRRRSDPAGMGGGETEATTYGLGHRQSQKQALTRWSPPAGTSPSHHRRDAATCLHRPRTVGLDTILG